MQKMFTEKEAENFLEKQGFDVAKRVFIKKKAEIKSIKINFPRVAKISGKHIIHKAKFGGTILGIKNIEETENAFEKLSKIKDCEGILIQEFIGGEEAIIGLKSTDEFGLVIMFGQGGGNVEKDKDISFRVLPIRQNDAEEMINETQFYKTKKEKISKDLLIENLLRISQLAEKHKNISELDINPLIINHKKAVVVDARISFI